MADSSNGATPEVLRWIASGVTMFCAISAYSPLTYPIAIQIREPNQHDECPPDQTRSGPCGQNQPSAHRDYRRDPPQNFRRSAIAAVRHTGLTVLIPDRYSAAPRPIHGGIGVPATLLPRGVAEIRDRA